MSETMGTLESMRFLNPIGNVLYCDVKNHLEAFPKELTAARDND